MFIHLTKKQLNSARWTNAMATKAKEVALETTQHGDSFRGLIWSAETASWLKKHKLYIYFDPTQARKVNRNFSFPDAMKLQHGVPYEPKLMVYQTWYRPGMSIHSFFALACDS